MTRKRVLALAALPTAVLSALGFFWPFSPPGESWRSLWPFGRSATELRLAGVVEIQEVRLGSKIGGRVAEVCVREGDVVQPGQLLVRFEVPELEAQHQQWQARLQSMEAGLEKAKNGPRPEEIRQARSDLEVAQTNLRLARENFARIEKIYRRGGSDQAEYDATRAARDQCMGQVGAAKAKLDLLLAGTRFEDIADAEARVVEMRGKIRELEANLQEALVRAPERAVVEVLAVRKGDLVPPNQPILRVLRADDLWIKVYVPETELGKVRLGQEVAVTSDSYPGRRFTGVVRQVASESEFTPRNVQSAEERRNQVFGTKVYVADPEGVFKSGMAAEAVFKLAP
jgi:multidrug resistance efflux pump